ncbi:hypothetical protein ABPG72_008958 [Tetrahymena utriculariae]
MEVLINEDLEYIALQFSQDQHHQTLVSLSYQIFSNFHQVNSIKKKDYVDQKLNKQKNEQTKIPTQEARRSEIKQKIKLEKLENQFFDDRYISQIGQNLQRMFKPF